MSRRFLTLQSAASTWVSYFSWLSSWPSPICGPMTSWPCLLKTRHKQRACSPHDLLWLTWKCKTVDRVYEERRSRVLDSTFTSKDKIQHSETCAYVWGSATTALDYISLFNGERKQSGTVSPSRTKHYNSLRLLLLLLRSLAISPGFTIFLVRLLHMWPFFNPTIEVVSPRQHPPFWQKTSIAQAPFLYTGTSSIRPKLYNSDLQF